MWIWVIIALIVLGTKPSRKNLFLLTGVVAIFSLAGYTFGVATGRIPNTPDFLVFYLGFLVVWLLVFLAIGFIIIWIRGGSAEGDASKGEKLDKEMERIRAEIAARDRQPPASS
jgi:hypothetical protein